MCTRESLLFLALVAQLSAFAQDPSPSKKQDTVYARALFASITEMDKEWGRQNDAPDYHRMFVEADPQITNELPSESAGYRVEFLDTKGQVSRYKKLGKEFALLKIHPMRDDGDHLEVTVSVYQFSYKKRHLMYGLSGSSDVEIRFNCEKQQFVISSVKLGGI